MRPLLAALVLLGCNKPAPHAIADAAPADVVLPIVSGCGCAYQCARALRTNPDGVWEVTHDFLDSTTVSAVIERRCFDDKGHAYAEAGAPKEATYCRRVFYDRSSCGGECIPTTAYLRCGEK
jgi:hypothetical protein